MSDADAAIAIVLEATMVSSGIVYLMELQEQGFGYIRP
jgi:intracellular sulfur oxidation DsrE/DsrF family protein